MITFNSLEDLKDYPILLKYHQEIYESTEIPQEESFMGAFGGEVNLVTESEDLKFIYSGFDPAKNLSNSSDSYDQCSWEGDYVLIFTATNNAGGPSYWIPREIAQCNFNVLRSIEETEEYWKFFSR